LRVEAGEESDWSQLLLSHKAGQEIVLIKRNPVIPGELGEEELSEFIENVRDEKPESASKWLFQFLPRMKIIYAFQLLSGTEINDGWDGVHSLRGRIWRELGGILQADLEGFSNEDGYHILWPFPLALILALDPRTGPSRCSCGAGNLSTTCRGGLYTRRKSCYCFFPYRHPCARRLGL